MTQPIPPCPSGSRPQAGSPLFFLYDQTDIITRFGAFAGWFTTWAMGLPSSPQTTAQFCQTFPAGDLPTTNDWLLLGVPLVALATGTYQRFANLVRQDKFAQLCECAPTATGSCVTRTFPFAFLPGNPTGSICGSNTWYLGGASVPNFAFPAGQHQVKIQIPITTTHDVQFDVYTASVPERCFTWLAGTSFEVNFTGNLSDAWFALAFRDGGSRPIWLESTQITLSFKNVVPGEADCAGAGTTITPPVLVAPPTGFPLPPAASCSTIADVCGVLTDLRNHLETLRLQVQLLQRWGQPFGYIDGITHTDLVDAGSVQCDRLLGIRVYVTTPPPGAPVLPGNPPYLFDCGWMSINDANGMLEEKRVTRSGFDWFPKQMPLATSFNWSLTPGTVVTVIEARPEP